jgi:hypothetical protein
MKKKRTPNLNTFRKIQELGYYREKYIKQHGKPPSFAQACRIIAILPKTVKRNASELVENWYQPQFHW